MVLVDMRLEDICLKAKGRQAWKIIKLASCEICIRRRNCRNTTVVLDAVYYRPLPKEAVVTQRRWLTVPYGGGPQMCKNSANADMDPTQRSVRWRHLAN